jgi:hypothetical protein
MLARNAGLAITAGAKAALAVEDFAPGGRNDGSQMQLAPHDLERPSACLS